MIGIRPPASSKPWLNLETSMCVPAAAAAATSHVLFCLPASFAAPLPRAVHNLPASLSKPLLDPFQHFEE
jgi:hypothetical protein